MPKKTVGSVESILLGKKVKIKYRDDGELRSIPGVVKSINDTYIVLGREKGADILFNHSIIDRIQLIDEFENDELDYEEQHMIDNEKRNNRTQNTGIE